MVMVQKHFQLLSVSFRRQKAQLSNNRCPPDNEVNGKMIPGHLYRVFFFTGPPPEFAKCRPVSNQFEKTLKVQDWPSLFDWDKLECSDCPPLKN